MLAVFPATATDRKRGAAPERFRKYRQTQLVYRVLWKSVKPKPARVIFYHGGKGGANRLSKSLSTQRVIAATSFSP
jgi:hypothetical protein